MFLLQFGIGFATCEIVLQIVVLHLQGNGVVRIDDVLHIVVIGNVFLVGEEAQGIDHTDGDACLQEVVERIVAVLNHIVQKSGNLFFVGMAHQAYGKRMEYHGIAIPVELSGMGACCNLEGDVYGVHGDKMGY